MRRIAFYIELSNQQTIIEKSNISLGNPGIGGTQYLYLLTVLFLSKRNNDVILLTDCDLKYKGIRFVRVSSYDEAVNYCLINKYNVLVLNATILNQKKILDCNNLKIWIWAHNSISLKWQKVIYQNDNIEFVVCVSDQQAQNMRSSMIFHKIVAINNILPPEFYSNCITSDYNEEVVVYVGSVYPQKGLDVLLKMWPKVEKVNPKAKLFVFGGAKIWNSNISLGKLGIADYYYDKVLEKKLSKIKNRENVVFWGPQNWTFINEKILHARVGVVNPSFYLRDETFCMSAVELEAHGIPVVSRMRNDGLITTIKHGANGFLEKNNKDIVKRIILLLNKEQANEFGTNAIQYSKTFVSENELSKWENLYDCREALFKSKKHEFVFKKEWFLVFKDTIRKMFYIFSSGKLKDKIMKKNR